MQKIRIAHIITRFDKGGSAENTFLSIAGLDQERFDITLITGNFENLTVSAEEKASIKENLLQLECRGTSIIFIPELVRDADLASDVKAFWSLVRNINKLRPHIIHTHTSKAGFIGRWAAFVCGVPVIVHTPHGHVFWGYFGPTATAAYKLLERATAPITDCIIALTEQERKDHLRFGIGQSEQFSVIHSGIDFSRIHKADTSAEMRAELDIPQKAVIVGTVGRLTPIKGQAYLLDAARSLIETGLEIYLVFLGEGELREDLQGRAKELGISKHVRFLGWRPEAVKIVSSFDIFVFPSLNEGMGKALAEAMALGKPVVASASCGIKDIVIPGVNGLLVPPGDGDAIAEGIRELLHDPALRSELGENAEKTALGLDADTMVSKLCRLYDELVQRKLLSPS